MKRLGKLISLLTVLFLLLSACTKATPTQNAEMTTSPTEAAGLQNDVLYLNLTWHQHQPLYYKDDDGVYTRPWVRVHATKDYYDMAAILKDYPNVHLTYNITPVLMKQLSDFVDNGAKDYYWVLSEKPASDLTEEEKTYIMTRFFDVNWTTIISRYPRFQELLDLRGGTDAKSIASAVANFTEQDFRDLQVWFNLAWFDPTWLEQEPLQALVQKGEGFSEEDKVILFDQVRAVMSQVIPVHKELQDAGQIQVITTPYAHPILPLIYNSDEAAMGNSTAELPERFSWPEDAVAHLTKSVEMYTALFGQAPVGLWPGEGAVSQDVVPLIADAGYQFMQTGEPVLARSLGIGEFTRDSNETVTQADDLYRPYYVSTEDGAKVAVFFRDGTLSDKIGFTYSSLPGEEAAADLMQRLENIRQQFIDQNVAGPHIVNIILDGENAWEYYPNDGADFLNSLYTKLNESETIKTVTPSEYLAMFPEQRELDHLFSGAWFSPNYDTWIGESEETLAWNYLGQVRDDLDAYAASHQDAASEEAIAQAFDYMYLAEGSDWFWWYGADQDSGVDGYFDTGFRALLAKVYESLGEPVPAFVNAPIIPKASEKPSESMAGLSTPLIDGLSSEEEWNAAAVYEVENGAPIKDLAFTMDAQNLYIRLSLSQPLPSSDRIGVYLKVPGAADSYSFTRAEAEAGWVGFSATHLYEWDGSTVTQYLASFANGWEEGAQVGEGQKTASTFEMSIPLDSLGELAAGDEIRMAVAVQPEGQLLPLTGPAQMIMPYLGVSTPVFEVEDPAGDDHGPGTYTYPTDGVFSAQNFDIEKFTVGVDKNNVIFTFKFFGAVPNPWSSRLNLSLQTMDVYIDKDPGQGTGNRQLLPGRNASLTQGNGWDVAIWAEGWTPGIYIPDPATGEPTEVDGSYNIIVDPAAQTVTLLVPSELLGGGDPTTWGYAAVVMSQEGYPSSGVWRIRDVEASAAAWKFGGAPADFNHTRIIDMVWPASETVTQEAMLGDYVSSLTVGGTFTEDDFAQIDLLTLQ